MRPLSTEMPKPLMPLWGKPVLDHTLEMLERWGVKEVLINLHHTPCPLIDHVRRRHPAGLHINLSYEPRILGTGGAIKRAEWFIGNSPFWIVNGDIVADVDPHLFLRAYRRLNPIAVLWMNEISGPRTVEMVHGIVTNFQAKRPGTVGTYTFCGLQLVSPRIAEFIGPETFSSITHAYSRAIKQGNLVTGISSPDAFWADIGSPDAYLEAHRHVLERFQNHQPGGRLLVQQQLKRMSRLRQSAITVDGFLSIGQNVRIGAGAHIRNSVIWDDVQIAPNSCVKNAIIGKGTRVRGRVNRMAIRADSMGDPDLTSAIEKIGWLSTSTTVLPLDPRGSGRTFTRIQHGTKNAIVIRYGLEREENRLYAQNAIFLQRIGVNVPEVLLDIPDKRLTIMEDIGNFSLLDRVNGKPLHIVCRSYCKVLDLLLIMHQRGTLFALSHPLELREPFSRKIYRWEHELFAHHFLAGRLSLGKSAISKILLDLRHVSKHLSKEPPVLVHRDLQSSNVLFRHGKPVLIDFQGMRFGPAVYDLASLLCDPYVSLTEQMQNSLITYYTCRVRRDEHAVRNIFWWATVQRLVQAIGAYARMAANPETEQFGRYIQPALRMLDRALAHVDKLSRLKSVVSYASGNSVFSESGTNTNYPRKLHR